MDFSNKAEYRELIQGCSSHASRLSELCNNDRLSAGQNHGLTTRDALIRLHRDMKYEVDKMKYEFSKRSFLSWLKESISFESELSKMRWPSVIFMTAQAIVHFIVAFLLEVDNLATNWVGFQGFILFISLLFNLSVNFWDTQLRFKELLMKSEKMLDLIVRCSGNNHLLKHWRQYSWNSAHVKSLFIPHSPCINQTLTYRDESCLNLPDYLLVVGDIIHLFPGERAPGDCISLSTKKNNEATRIKLKEGQIFYSSTSSHEHEVKRDVQESIDINNVEIASSHEKLKKCNRGKDFVMLSTPYAKSLQISLQRSHKRPVNSVEKECFIVSRKYFETYVIPSVFLLSTIVTAIHYGYLDLTDSDQKIKTISIAHLLMRPSLTIMPFLPWMFPCLWLAVNAYGSARILCCGEAQREKAKNKINENEYHDYSPTRIDTECPLFPSKFENLLATPTAAGSSENKHGEDDLNDLRSEIKFLAIFKVFVALIKGDSGHVWRSSSLIQVLGCLTSLCFIDKVGILSWSNPTPEKVFIMTKTEAKSPVLFPSSQHVPSDDMNTNDADDGSEINQSPLTSSLKHAKSDTEIFHDDETSLNNRNRNVRSHTNIIREPEVLDISYALASYRDFPIETILCQQHIRLQFDELNWKKYLNNLKPLGLAILMNNCNEDSFGDYFRFYKHISYESIIRCNLTPVVKRRCICALSKLIGFSKDTTDKYKYLNQIGFYKLIDPSLITKKKLASSLENTSRLKLPFSNMTCNIHKDIDTDSQSVFSQGTADIILDACTEYWDGDSLVPLDDSSRKKIMDFYHRNSLTSYCSAFSYSPILNRHKLDDYYIELPSDKARFASQLKKLINEQHEDFLQNQTINLPIYNKKSSESHLFNQIPQPSDDALDEISIGLKLPRRHMSAEDVLEVKESSSTHSHDGQRISETVDELTDQVFVGMVAMQYQACPDFVALVEQLEHACIRFVHFSKENELRSRVFSEKMGLESGWNCHISLQSDQDLDKALEPDKTFGSNDSSSDILNEEIKTATFSPTPKIAALLGRLIENSDDESTSAVGADDQYTSWTRGTIHSWTSLPSIIMQLTAKLFVEQSKSTSSPVRAGKNTRLIDQNDLTDQSGNNPEEDSGLDVYQSPEEVEANTNDEAFDALAFDMSNRAKLPKGIENIRPHLETVDNVPLQVSLFTDCTPTLTQEMIEIMQEYGEIVCVIGSSSSRLNTPLFLQANASIAIEPLVPESCTHSDHRRKNHKSKTKNHSKKKAKKQIVQQAVKIKKDDDTNNYITISMQPRLNPRDRLGIGPKEAVKPVAKPQTRSSQSISSSSSSSSSTSSSDYSSSEESDDNSSIYNPDETMDPQSSNNLLRELPTPSALASKLASLPCSYSYNRKDQVNLYSLILEARHFTFKMKNTFVCMICFALSISSAQFLASILFLPPMLSSGLTIWLTIIVVPLMSFSLMNTTMDSQVMKIAVGKNLQLKPENITFFVLCYLLKFIPSIIVVVLNFGLIIAHSCKLTGFGSSSLGPCWMFTYVQHGNTTSSDTGDEDLLWSTHLLTAQVCAAFLLVLYFVVISAEFVHRSHLMWQRSPTRNHIWVIISLGLIVGQIIYNQLVLEVNLSSTKLSYEFISSLPLHIWMISFTWPLVVICINLLVKRAEIKATIRQQRRARFDFNTKLGMNSPF